MNRSLYTKLVLIILFLIIVLMLVAGVFLTRGVRSFYLNDFYDNMSEVFADNEVAVALREAAADDSPAYMSEILGVYAGRLGIDRGTRNYHILDGATGDWLAGSVTMENGDNAQYRHRPRRGERRRQRPQRRLYGPRPAR